jgi:hypothetical protein
MQREMAGYFELWFKRDPKIWSVPILRLHLRTRGQLIKTADKIAGLRQPRVGHSRTTQIQIRGFVQKVVNFL